MPLVLVLWGAGLLALIAASLLTTSVISQKLAQNALDVARLEAIAEAAVSRAAIGLAERIPENRWRADGKEERFAFAGVQATIKIDDELGRIDLNYADPELLAGLLQSVGQSAETAREAVDAIVHWRQSADLQAAKLNNDRAIVENAPVRVRHGPFQSIDEILLVPGVTREMYNLISPAITVYSQRQTIDSRVASAEALRALPGMTPERVIQILGERKTQDGMDGNQSDVRGRAFRIKVDIEQAAGARSYKAIIRMTGNPSKLFWLLDWHEETR